MNDVMIADYDKMQRLMGYAEILRKEFDVTSKEIQQEFESGLKVAWKSRFPRRKFSMKASADPKTGNQPKHTEIFEYWGQKVLSAYKSFRHNLDLTEKMMVVTARLASIPVTKEKTLFHVVSSESFRSQGFGMFKYAEALAQDYVDKAESYGLQSELRTVLTFEGRDSFGHTVKFHDFEVWVSTDEIGVEILRRKPDKQSMSEWVASCDRRGVNARVLCPLLSAQDIEKFRQESKVGG